MAIADDVAAVLNDKNVNKIDFQLGPLAVNGAELRKIAKAIGDKTIELVVKSAGKQLSAAYSPTPIRRMTLSSGKIASAFDKSGIVHESIHAVVDLSGHKAIGGRMDEVAGYLGESVYLAALGVGLSQVAADPAGKAIYKEAYALHALLKKRKKLNPKDVEALGTAIHLNPAYADL
jgi:hypothetical protein